MTEANQVDTERSWEATCYNLIDFENFKWNEREVHQPESNGTRLQKTCKTVCGDNAESSKGTKDYKCTYNAVNRTSQDIKHTPTELTPLQPHQHYHIERQEDRREKEIIAKEDAVSTENSSGGEDEGAYEELICLVRQFYVERPGNPAAIAYQNIETC